MLTLSSRNQFNYRGEAQIKDRNIGTSTKNGWQNVIEQANTIDLLTVLQAYNVQIDKYSKKCICPLHKENSPSFYYYEATNSWYCFGCKKGGSPVNFVSQIEKITTVDAADRLLGNFTPNGSLDLSSSDFLERQEIVLKFSLLVRNFIHSYLDNDALEAVEKLTLIFDTIVEKHSLDNKGLELIVGKLEQKLIDLSKDML